MLWSALTCMNHVPTNQGRSCIFRVVRVSGTIRKVEEEAIRQARQLILAAKQHLKGESLVTQLQSDEPMLEVVEPDSDLDSDVDVDDDDG